MNQREPTLEELLSEPIVQQVMRSDGVDADEIRGLMHAALARRAPDPFDGMLPAMTGCPQPGFHGCAAP